MLLGKTRVYGTFLADLTWIRSVERESGGESMITESIETHEDIGLAEKVEFSLGRVGIDLEIGFALELVDDIL